MKGTAISQLNLTNITITELGGSTTYFYLSPSEGSGATSSQLALPSFSSHGIRSDPIV